MYQLDAAVVKDTVSGARFIHKDGRFDRIDASNIAGEDYLGISRTLEVCSPLLKHQIENSHAALLTGFIVYPQLVSQCSKAFGFAEQTRTQKTTEFMMKLLPPLKLEDTLAEAHRRKFAADLFKDNNEMFRRYTEMCRFSEAALESGLKQRNKNKILDKLPRKLELSDNTEESRREVEMRLSYSDVSEVYVEWTKARDYPPRSPGSTNRREGLFDQMSTARIFN
jgi:hypothetical protein